MPKLLVSVKSLVEARAALAGGCAIVDCKNPARGPLGRADSCVIEQLLADRAAADGRAEQTQFSAALGELAEVASLPSEVSPTWDQLTYLKAGAAGLTSFADWREALRVMRQKLRDRGITRPGWIAAMYVDYAAAGSWNPFATAERLEEWWACLHDQQVAGVLFDTWNKQGPSTWEWLQQETGQGLPAGPLKEFLQRCRDTGLLTALAGRLSAQEIRQMAAAGILPDYYAVRSAVCEQQRREGEVCGQRVSELADWLKACSDQQTDGEPRFSGKKSFDLPDNGI